MSRSGQGGGERVLGEKGIATFGAEEVLFVICALPERGVIERDEAFVDNGCFAVVASRCK